MALLPLILLLLITPLSLGTSNPCLFPSVPGDIRLVHVNSRCSPMSSLPTTNPFESLLQLTRRVDHPRLTFLSTLSQSLVPIASGQHIVDSAIYLLRASIGSPPQPILLSLDSAADASFLASPNFTSSSTFQPLSCSSLLCPLFKPLTCPTSSSLCNYNQSYGGDSSFSAALAQDSLLLANDTIPTFTFGAVVYATGPSFPKQGLLGIGRGPASLLSQTSSLYHSIFSYCLPGYGSYYFTGSLRLGPLKQPARIRFTPLLFNPHRPSLFYLNLTGVSVGRVRVPAPPESFVFDPNTGAGTVIDSGTVITRFVAPAYAAIRDEFRRQVNATNGYEMLGAFDTCYLTGDAGVIVGPPPVVTLHMDGLDLVLPAENAMIHSSGRPLACLALAAAPANVNSVVNVIASYQQQNHRVLVDVPGARVGFAREICS